VNLVTLSKADLKKNNYLRRASPKHNYWVDFAQGKIEQLKHGNAFNIIVANTFRVAGYVSEYLKLVAVILI